MDKPIVTLNEYVAFREHVLKQGAVEVLAEKMGCTKHEADYVAYVIPKYVPEGGLATQCSLGLLSNLGIISPKTVGDLCRAFFKEKEKSNLRFDPYSDDISDIARELVAGSSLLDHEDIGVAAYKEATMISGVLGVNLFKKEQASAEIDFRTMAAIILKRSGIVYEKAWSILGCGAKDVLKSVYGRKDMPKPVPRASDQEVAEAVAMLSRGRIPSEQINKILRSRLRYWQPTV